ncbi:hypothetical protein I656_02258 [Geobacillus sp. WSUCF1]|nr:hypothetical protein I656_02258 [Geobacillus sp. WSUCF1]
MHREMVRLGVSRFSGYAPIWRSGMVAPSLFQARMYWHQQEGIEISERKAPDLLQSY